MPTFLDGQQNLSALSVPGVYVDVILPQPLLIGAPTNIEGLIGVASWGPTNAVVMASQISDAALNLGPPQIRTYDITSHIAAATQVGGSIGFACVRVTDGTDTAAQAVIKDAAGAATGVTLTAKYTGTLGNQIQASIQNGSQLNTLMCVIAFPGLQPQQFNNIPTGATNASGSIVFTLNPTASQTVTLGGTAITFVTSNPSGPQVVIGASLAATLQNLALFLNASTDTNISKCNYASSAFTSTLTITSKTSGTSNNSFSLVTTVTGATVSGATLTGGAAASNTFWVNLTNAINNGNAFSGPSNNVVATVGASTALPALSSPVTLTGGTDGSSGVTDATLMGQDVLPRKGVYVLRGVGCDCFTPIDMTTISYWAALVSLALSENMMAIVSTASGTSYANTITDRNNAGADSPWIWILSGDYPTFFDSYNSVSRLINPTAFAIGIVGNLSPQESPLNKPLQGVSSTQTSAVGEVYSEADLSLINLGGIDVILPATQSPGGFYYSFATGRNASSNTAANGVEYTRMTNYLAKTAQSKAAGSFIGRLQSIQPNDQTRQQAKALFDGFSAFLASPQVGLGINGQGIIDIPWFVQCDLNNNPPATQARGYLFLYWQVRYLNVIRYFVIKFQGGGNVTVSTQDTVPSVNSLLQ